MRRPLALTIPDVTVCSSPNGLPMASTHSPTSRAAESPSRTTGNFRSTSILINAISVLGSRPTTLAPCSEPSESLTVSSSSSSTT